MFSINSAAIFLFVFFGLPYTQSLILGGAKPLSTDEIKNLLTSNPDFVEGLETAVKKLNNESNEKFR